MPIETLPSGTKASTWLPSIACPWSIGEPSICDIPPASDKDASIPIPQVESPGLQQPPGTPGYLQTYPDGQSTGISHKMVFTSTLGVVKQPSTPKAALKATAPTWKCLGKIDRLVDIRSSLAAPCLWRRARKWAVTQSQWFPMLPARISTPGRKGSPQQQRRPRPLHS